MSPAKAKRLRLRRQAREFHPKPVHIFHSFADLKNFSTVMHPPVVFCGHYPGCFVVVLKQQRESGEPGSYRETLESPGAFAERLQRSK